MLTTVPARQAHLLLTLLAGCLLVFFAAGAASAQCPYPCWSEVTKAHFTFHYNSPSFVSEPSSPGINFYLPMPPETARTDSASSGCPANTPDGSYMTLSGCQTYGDLIDNHYVYNFATSSYSTTPIPYSCPVDEPPQTYYATDSGALGGPYGGWKGIAFRGSFSGVISATGDASNNYLTQAVFFYAEKCFEVGTEFGFYRRLQLPHGTMGADGPENTIYFYYALNSNCGGFQPGTGPGQGQAGCVHKGAVAPFSPSDSDSPTYPVLPITIPTALNSHSGSDWIYEAWVVADPNHTYTCGGSTDGYSWEVQVLDPYDFSPAPGSSVQTWPISDCSFLAAASDLTPQGAGLTGYAAITHQISIGSNNWGILGGSPVPTVTGYNIWAAK